MKDRKDTPKVSNMLRHVLPSDTIYISMPTLLSIIYSRTQKIITTIFI